MQVIDVRNKRVTLFHNRMEYSFASHSIFWSLVLFYTVVHPGCIYEGTFYLPSLYRGGFQIYESLRLTQGTF